MGKVARCSDARCVGWRGHVEHFACAKGSYFRPSGRCCCCGTDRNEWVCRSTSTDRDNARSDHRASYCASYCARNDARNGDRNTGSSNKSSESKSGRPDAFSRQSAARNDHTQGRCQATSAAAMRSHVRDSARRPQEAVGNFAHPSPQGSSWAFTMTDGFTTFRA